MTAPDADLPHPAQDGRPMPATDEWASKDRGGNGSPQITVNWPSDVTGYIEDRAPGASLRVVRLNFGGVTFRREVSELRLLLQSAIEILDRADQLDREHTT